MFLPHNFGGANIISFFLINKVINKLRHLRGVKRRLQRSPRKTKERSTLHGDLSKHQYVSDYQILKESQRSSIDI